MNFLFLTYVLIGILWMAAISLLLVILTKQKNKYATKILLAVMLFSSLFLFIMYTVPVHDRNRCCSTDTRRIAEMKALETALLTYKKDSGHLPETLDLLIPDYLPMLPKSLINKNAPGKEKMNYVSYSGKEKGALGYIVFGYHIGTELSNFNVVLNADADCIGTEGEVTNGSLRNPCAIFPKTIEGQSIVIKDMYGHITSDFQGLGINETQNSTCRKQNECVYDITGV